MIKKLFPLIASVALTLCIVGHSHAEIVTNGNAKNEIVQLVTEFSRSVSAKDQRAFTGLFYDVMVPYVVVEPSQRKGTLASGSGIAPSVGGYFKYRYFSNEIKFELPVKNLKVRTDGKIGSAHFQFEEIEAGKVTRSGDMAFQLVRTIDGFRISSLILSDRLGIALDKTATEQAKIDIKALVKSFEISHEEKDSKRYFDMYYDNSVPIFAATPASRTSDLFTESGVWPYSYLGYFKWVVVPDPEPLFIEIKDLEIITDGEIATVHFHSIAHWGKYLNGWGDMIFHLGRTPDGWKITSQTETGNSNPVSRQEFNAKL